MVTKFGEPIALKTSEDGIPIRMNLCAVPTVMRSETTPETHPLVMSETIPAVKERTSEENLLRAEFISATFMMEVNASSLFRRRIPSAAH